MKMPFGKWKGCELSELPDSYLKWLSTLELYESLRCEVDEEIQSRLTRDHTRRAFGLPAPGKHVDRGGVEEIIGAGLRTLAKKHHPDLGGDPEAMKRINLAAAWLREAAAWGLPEVEWSLREEVERRLRRTR